LPEGLEKSERFGTAVLPIYFQEASERLAPPGPRILDTDPMFECRPQLGPISRRLDRAFLDDPNARAQTCQEERLELLRRPASHHGTQMRKATVVWEDFHEHPEFGNEPDRLERAPVRRRFVPRSLDAHFPPSLVGLGAIRAEQAGEAGVRCSSLMTIPS